MLFTNVHSDISANLQGYIFCFRLEKQTIVEVKPVNTDNVRNDERIAAKTKEILEKIAEVNKKHGWTSKRQKPNYFQFPFGYFKSNNAPPVNSPNRQRSDFNFPSNPFSNPIFEYLEREKYETGNTEYQNKFDVTTRQSMDGNSQLGYTISMTNPNAEITEEDMIPGQYVKRKIVHQQTILIPNPNYVSPQMGAMVPNMFPNFAPQYAPQVPFLNMPSADLAMDNNRSDNKILNNIEKQTIDNIRNIVSNSHMSQFANMPSYNPNQQLPSPNLIVPPQAHYGFIGPNRDALGQIPYNIQTFGPNTLLSSTKGRQNWNWPGSNYFPIHIRDPFMQMYNAFTSMIEYGPGAGTSNPCPGKKPIRKKAEDDIFLREAKTTDSTQLLAEESRSFDSSESSIVSTTESDKDYLNMENIDVATDKDGKVTFVAVSKDRAGKDGETAKLDWEKIKAARKATATVMNNTRPNSKTAANLKQFPSVPFSKTPTVKSPPVISPPPRYPSEQSDESEEEETEKSEEIISNDGNKKFFSRDNTGSGVFINRLKVRKGGVAIAGPGGIATAGSGGTAIVGPNGVAYTHPDSLAIAGSGTKVVAVDPSINLRDLVRNSTNADKTNHSFPPSRVGKVVAVGPVVYYNKG